LQPFNHITYSLSVYYLHREDAKLNGAIALI
jgi:hypothetical protein